MNRLTGLYWDPEDKGYNIYAKLDGRWKYIHTFAAKSEEQAVERATARMTTEAKAKGIQLKARLIRR